MQLKNLKQTPAVLILLTLTILLSSCSSLPEIVKYSSEPVERPLLVLPESEIASMRGVDYIIVTEDNITEVWAELEAAGKPIVLFALTSDGYENLALNSAEIIRFLSEQRAVIIAYKEYYEKADKTIDSYNKDNELDDEEVEGSSLSSIKKFLSVD